MSTQQDITNEKRSATGVAVFETESENQTAQGRACDYADLVHHHNERAKARPADQPEPQTDPVPASDEGPGKQGRKKKEPAQLTTDDPAGEIPFSNWDGEEGPRP